MADQIGNPDHHTCKARAGRKPENNICAGFTVMNHAIMIYSSCFHNNVLGHRSILPDYITTKYKINYV